MEPASSYVSFRIEAIQFNGPVVVVYGLERIFQIEMRSAPVKEGCRVFRFNLDVSVEILYCLIELLGEEMGYSATEVEAYIAGSQ